MKRVLIFFETEAQVWKSRAEYQKGAEDGRHGYACQQSALSEGLKAHFQELWKEVDEMVRLKGMTKGKGKEQS